MSRNRQWRNAAAMALFFAAAALGGEDKGGGKGDGVPPHNNWEWTESERSKIEAILPKVKADEKGFWVYEQQAYSVCTNLSARFTAETAFYVSYFVETFPKIFPLPPHGNMLVKLAVTVYKTRAQYLAATDAPEWSSGIHRADFGKSGWPVLQVMTFVFDRPAAEEADFCRHLNHKVLQHEATHAMLQKFAGRTHAIPVFINEGCASYFETWDLRTPRMTDEARARRSFRSSHLGALVAKLRSTPDFRPSLAAYLKIDHKRWGSGEVALNYGLAESFIDFLLADRQRREIFKRIIERIYKRQPEVLAAEEISRLEPLWHEHLKNSGAAVAKNLILNITDENGNPRGPAACEGVIASGQRVTVRGLPNGVAIAPEELKTCKNLDDVRALVARKISGRSCRGLAAPSALR